MKKELLLLNCVLYAIAFFIVLPNGIKEIPFALLSLLSIVFFIKEKKIDLKILCIITLFLIINGLSLVYTKDLAYGLKRIEGFLPMLYLAFSYAVFSKMNVRFEKKFVTNWIVFFNSSTLSFLIIIGLYFYFHSIHVNYNTIRTVFDEIPFINIHPIYLSILAVLGIATCVYIFEKNKHTATFFVLCNLVLLYLTGARSGFIGFFLILFFVFFLVKFPSKSKVVLGIISIIFIAALFTFNTDFKKRFREMVIPISFSKVNPENSTSVRFVVWNCSIQQIKNTNILIGNGIGDVPLVLQECYDAHYPKLDKYYNTHNQYFSIMLGTGLIGLISFLFFFIYLFNHALKCKNNFQMISILFYIYMFNFENIIERKYGILVLFFFLFYVFDIFIRPIHKVDEKV